jgi:hypothetical protein
MAAVSLRRSVATTALAAIATALVPAAVSLAAPSAFSASSITTDPKPDSSDVVAANRPTIIATFSDNLASGSISLTVDGGSSENLCATQSVSGKTVSCKPTADLDKTKKYDAVGNGTNSSGAKAKTDTLQFTVDYPVLDPANSVPVPNGALTGGGEDIVAAFDEGVACDTNTFHPNGAFKLFEVNADGSRGVQLGGSISCPSNPIQGSDGTVDFNPAANLSQGRYEAVLFVNGVDSQGNANPKAIGTADYSVFINNTPPFNLNIPVPKYPDSTGATRPYANTSNNTAFPFSGVAAPGLTVTVDVTDPKDPNPLTNTYEGSATVEPCASAPACPWTVPVDISDNATPMGFTSPQNNIDWTASIKDANGQPSSNPPTSHAKDQGATFDVDFSAPPAVSTNPAPAISSDSKTVTVNATDTATDVVSYLITITDPEGNKITPSFPAQNHNLPPTPVDVTALDDGQLNIIIQAVDNVGNVSPAQSTPFHVTKNVGLEPNLGTSVLSANGTDITFFEAENQSVQSPDKVTVGFTQAIKQSVQDQTKVPPATNDSSMCVASQNGNCLVSDKATVADDGHSISMPVKNPLTDGTYQIRVTTYSAGNCPTKTVQNMQNYKCESFSGVVTDPNTGLPFQFRVDSTKPSIAITAFPNPVTAQNEHSVTISGTVSKTASSVQLIISSSGNSSQKLLINNVAITQPGNSSDPNATWAASGVDLSSLPDGTLTIKATAKKTNGTSATATAHAKMQAHLSKLTEIASRHTITAGQAVKIGGHLSDENGAAITAADITIRPKFASGHFGKKTTVATDGSGNYSATIVPKHSATYYTTYQGSPEHDGATANTAHVGVKYAVRIGSPHFGAHVSSPVTVSGSVKPAHAGAIVTIFRHTASGNTVVGKARLNKQSRFSAKVVLPSGTNKIYASVKKTKANQAGKSKMLTLHVS